jgi:hypothetical protein
MNKLLTSPDGQIRVGGIEYCFWLDLVGKGRTVGWKWRKKGWVKCENIDGKWFITQKEIDRFWQRVEAEEFAKQMSGVCAKTE